MTDQVIDIQRYLGTGDQGREGRAFAVWGGEGERTRFALPVWRAIHLVGGERGGIVSLAMNEDGNPPVPFFLLDLRKDPADLTSPVSLLRGLGGEGAPALGLTEEGELAVLLGEDGKRWWFLQVLGIPQTGPLDRENRETLLFLAGECAGLLFFRELAC